MTSSAWRKLCDAVDALQKAIGRNKAVNVNSTSLRQSAHDAANLYLRTTRPELATAEVSEIASLDALFAELLRLSTGRNPTKSYKGILKQFRQLRSKVTIAVELHWGSRPRVNTHSEGAIIETLDRLVPSAALSFRQALQDLADGGRVSFRGPAAELRETLREVVDYLAPDEEVKGQPGFKLETDAKKPTMRQKVVFVLKARGRSKNDLSVPADTAQGIEDVIGRLSRSVYTQGSIKTHVSSSRSDVAMLRRYIEVLLIDLLEIDA